MKNHQRVREKIDYERWIHFRKLVDRARAYLSWRELSHRVGKDNAGWATKAYKHRSLVSESDVQDLEELVRELESHPDREERKMKKTLEKNATVEQRTEHFQNLVSMLQGAGVGVPRIASAMGYERPSDVQRMISDPSRAPSQGRLQGLQDRIEDLLEEVGEVSDGVRKNGRPEPVELDPPEPVLREEPKKKDAGPTEVTLHQWNTAIDRTREKLVEAAMELEGTKEDFPGLFQDAIDGVVNRIMAIAEELE